MAGNICLCVVRHVVGFDIYSINEGSNCVLMTWRIMSNRPYGEAAAAGSCQRARCRSPRP
jgi:hypothetical protein